MIALSVSNLQDNKVPAIVSPTPWDTAVSYSLSEWIYLFIFFLFFLLFFFFYYYFVTNFPLLGYDSFNDLIGNFQRFDYQCVMNLWHRNYWNGMNQIKSTRNWLLQPQDRRQHSQFQLPHCVYRIYWISSLFASIYDVIT